MFTRLLALRSVNVVAISLAARPTADSLKVLVNQVQAEGCFPG